MENIGAQLLPIDMAFTTMNGRLTLLHRVEHRLLRTSTEAQTYNSG